MNYIAWIMYFANVDELRDVVVLDPQWFGINVIGRVLAPNKDDLKAHEAMLFDPTEGKYFVELEAFCEFIATVSQGSKFCAVPDAYVDQVVVILKELQVCCVVDGSHVGQDVGINYLVFPSVLTSSATDDVVQRLWIRVPQDQGRMLLGRRLQCDDVCYLIPSGFFPKLQVCLQQLFGDKDMSLDLSTLHIWYHGLYVKTNDGIEALIQHSYEDIHSRQYVDVMVWDCAAIENHLAPCKAFLDQLIRLCEVQQREHHFGRVALTRYVLLPKSVYDPQEGTLVTLGKRQIADSEAALDAKIATL
jgi:hypothetical protein